MDRLAALLPLRGSASFLRSCLLACLATGVVWGQPVGLSVAAKSTGYVKREVLRPELEFALAAYGDRLVKPGRERVTWSGSLVRKGAADKKFTLTGELPDLIRIDIQDSPDAAKSVGFDGNSAWKAGGALQKEDSDLIETLLYDTPERFFLMQSQGVSLRKLGSNFRLDGKVGTPYSGPTYDVYFGLETVKASATEKVQPKYYLVNYNTLLLERVQYEDASAGGVKVQTLIEAWRTVDGNKVPGIIRRVENGVEVMRLTIGAASLGPAVADNAFRAKGN